MRRRWSGLILGFLFTSALGCRSLEQETAEATAAITPPPTPTAVSPPPVSTETLSPDPTDPIRQPNSTHTPPALPADWQYLQDDQAGLQLAMPGDWSDLSDHLTPETAVTPYGALTLFAASERAGITLLNGKEAAPTGLALGMLNTTTDPPPDLRGGLQALLAPLSSTLTLQPGSITALSIGAPPRPAAQAIGDGVPLPLLSPVNGELRARFLYFPWPATAVSLADETAQAHYLLLLVAPSDQWSSYTEQFDQIVASLESLPSNALGRRDSPFRFRGPLRPGFPGEGNLERDISHLWTLPLESSGFLSLTLASRQHLDLGFTLYTPEGETLAQIDNGFAGDVETLTDLPLETAGRYGLAVSEFNGEPGPYTVSLALTTAPQLSGRGAIRPGQTVQTRLAPEQNHIWRFNGTAGQRVSVVLTPLNDEIDLILNVYDPEGERLVALDEGFSGDPEVAAGFQLPTTGDYDILVSSFANAGGEYALALNEGGDNTINFYDAGDLLPGETMQETLRANEAHAWFFQGSADQSAIIQATPLDPELDLDLWLLDPDVNRLAIQDKFLTGEGETLQRTLPRDGQYVVLVREFLGNAGAYEISLMLLPTTLPVYNGTLTPGTAGNGTLGQEETAFWLFDGESGEIVDVRLEPEGESADLILTVQTPDGDTVLTVDNGSNGDAEIVAGLPLNADGQWRLLVREFLGETAAYTITVSKQSP